MGHGLIKAVLHFICPRSSAQEDFRDARPGQQVAVVHGAVPSAREKLLLADAVRLLRLEPLAKEAQLVAVYTLNAG